MYIRLARLRRFSVTAQRERLGNVDSLYFDHDDWAVRFLSLAKRTGRNGLRSVVVSPMSLTRARPAEEAFDAALRSEPFERSDGDGRRTLPGSFTTELTAYYRLPAFWRGVHVWGDYASPALLYEQAGGASGSNGYAGSSEPPDLYPHNILMGREVHSPDGRLGVISDLLLDLETWRIRYFIVWLQAPGESGEILLSPFWVNGLPRRPRVTVPMTTEAVLNGPNFVPEDLQPLDEQILARYFGFLKD